MTWPPVSISGVLVLSDGLVASVSLWKRLVSWTPVGLKHTVPSGMGGILRPRLGLLGCNMTVSLRQAGRPSFSLMGW